MTCTSANMNLNFIIWPNTETYLQTSSKKKQLRNVNKTKRECIFHRTCKLNIVVSIVVRLWLTNCMREHVRRLKGLGTWLAGSGPICSSLRQTRWYMRISSRWRSFTMFHTAVAEPRKFSGINESRSTVPPPSLVAVPLSITVEVTVGCRSSGANNSSFNS